MQKKMGRPRKFSGDSKIRKIVKYNPRREGTIAHDNFKIFKNSMKVDSYLKAGGDLRDLRYSVKKGWIEILESSN